jgi:4'-phosphopantetheinyl transferase
MSLLTLSRNHVDIWLVRPNKIDDQNLLTQYAKLLSQDEQTKVQRYIRKSDQHSALITRAFIRSLLSHYADIEPQDWQFGRGFNGKPYLKNAPTSLEFNLSHADNMIVCAVTKTHALGIDVEYTKRNSDTYKLAPRYFSPAEVTTLQQFEYAQQPDHFYDYWTLKESYIKACGDGLAIPLNHFSFDLNDRDNIRLSFVPQRNDDPNHWQSWLFNASSEHRMALTIKAPNAEQVTITTRYLTPLAAFTPVQLPL